MTPTQPTATTTEVSEAMVERIARDIFENFMDWQFGQPLQWEGTPPPNADELDREWRDGEWKEQREYHLRVARAAVNAMGPEIRSVIVALGEIRKKVHAHNRGGGLSLSLRKEIRDIADAALEAALSSAPSGDGVPGMVLAAKDLLASLDQDALNPEQFNAWHALDAALTSGSKP